MSHIKDNRRFSPRVISQIQDIFSIVDYKENSGSNYFLTGNTKQFHVVKDGKEVSGSIKTFISGLSVEKAINDDFFI